MLSWLLGEGGVVATLDMRNENGDTAFIWACDRGKLECAQALAAAGCDMAAASNTGHTALTAAAGRGRASVVVWMLGDGGVAGMMEARTENGDTAFLWACFMGQLECAQALALAGCDLAGTNSKGSTALMAASSGGHAAVLSWLLGEGGVADTLEARDQTDLTAFLWACNNGKLECAQALALAGCDVAITSSKATTALMAASSGAHAGVVAWLLEEGGAASTLEARNEAGRTAFGSACLTACVDKGPRQLECVELLARAGCDMDVKIGSGNHGTRHLTGKTFSAKAIAQRAGHTVLVARLGELQAERATATQRREVDKLMAAGDYRASVALLVKLLRQSPDDAELECLLTEAERRRGEADAAADVLARAAEAELLAMEAGEQAAESSKVGKKKQKRKRQQERARAAKATVEAAARAREREPVPELEAVSVAALQPQPQGEMDVVEALLAGLGLAEEHVLACREHEMDLGALR